MLDFSFFSAMGKSHPEWKNKPFDEVIKRALIVADV